MSESACTKEPRGRWTWRGAAVRCCVLVFVTVLAPAAIDMAERSPGIAFLGMLASGLGVALALALVFDDPTTSSAASCRCSRRAPSAGQAARWP